MRRSKRIYSPLGLLITAEREALGVRVKDFVAWPASVLEPIRTSFSERYTHVVQRKGAVLPDGILRRGDTTGTGIPICTGGDKDTVRKMKNRSTRLFTIRLLTNRKMELLL